MKQSNKRVEIGHLNFQLIFADGAERWIIQAQERSRPWRGLEAEAARHPAQAQAVRGRSDVNM